MNLPTGYGKSLIFQCLPIAADALFERPHGSSVIVVIPLLRALMEDQVRQLNDIRIPVIAITDEQDKEFMQQVLNSNFALVYGFPECLLCTESWRSIFGCESFKKMLIRVAIVVSLISQHSFYRCICSRSISKINLDLQFRR